VGVPWASNDAIFFLHKNDVMSVPCDANMFRRIKVYGRFYGHALYRCVQIVGPTSYAENDFVKDSRL